MNIKVGKKTVLQGLSLVFGVGSLVVGLASKQDETEEAAKKAAEMVMKKMNK